MECIVVGFGEKGCARCKADGWIEVAAWGRAKAGLLKQFLELRVLARFCRVEMRFSSGPPGIKQPVGKDY